MAAVVTDTHAALWYLLQSPRLSEAALRRLEQSVGAGDQILLPSICLVEVIYLVEKGRLPAEAWDRLQAALSQPDSGLAVAALDEAVARAVSRVPRAEVPDLPDRIIAATALHMDLPLISRDRRIQAPGVEVIW
jgi:PIN domain nuclease of toxin-antitoxin system